MWLLFIRHHPLKYELDAVRYITPPFGMYAALSAQLSGNLRHSHSRLAEFAEEIAFFGGEQTEKMLIERDFATVIKHENRVLRRRWWFGCLEEGVIKWLWGSFGVWLLRSELCFCLRGGCSLCCVLYQYSSRYPVCQASTWAVAQKVSAVSSILPRAMLSPLLN